MEKRIHLYVSKKHPALWLTGLLMLASVVARIAQFSQVEDAYVWRQIVWPSVAVILFVLMAFLNGEEMLYRTAVPVWMLGICEMWQLYFVLSGRIPYFYTPDGSEVCGVACTRSGLLWYGAQIPAGAESVPW